MVNDQWSMANGATIPRVEALKSVLIRHEREDDAAAIRSVYQSAFPETGEARAVDELRKTSDLYLGLVAEDDGSVVGHLVLTEVSLATHAGDRRGLGLAPMGVAPAHQKKGIGGALVREAIAEGKRRGDDFIVVMGDAGYYGRFGFRRGAPTLRWRSESYDPYFMVYPLREGILDDLRGTVTYHPAIESLE